MKIINLKFSPADAATCLNLVCGLLSMLMAAHGQPYHAIWLIVMAMMFDSVDGNLARMFKTTSEFGRQFDSLSDMVSFGVAPAFLFAETFTQPSFSFTAFLIPASYTVCAAVRLARFNMRAPVHGYFQGLPSPAAALGVVLFLLASLKNDWIALPIFEGVAFTIMAVIAGLMVSSALYPKPFGPAYKDWKPFLALNGAVFLLVWALSGREPGFMAAIFFYIAGVPFYGLTLRRKLAAALD